jgi:hypothetical protein
VTIPEIEEYYGKEAADFVRLLWIGGKSIPMTVCLKNPKCERMFLSFKDVIDAGCPDTPFELPDKVRYSDIVRVTR